MCGVTRIIDLTRAISSGARNNEKYTEFLGKEYLGFHLVEHFLRGVALKRSPAGNEFEQQDAQRPDIYLGVIGLILHHFRRHVLIRAAESLPLAQNCSEPEIAELGPALARQQNVFRLSIE